MNGKKSKQLRKKFNVKRISHNDTEESYDYKQNSKKVLTGKVTEEGYAETVIATTFVASLKPDTPRKLYRNAKKQYTTQQENI